MDCQGFRDEALGFGVSCVTFLVSSHMGLGHA